MFAAYVKIQLSTPTCKRKTRNDNCLSYTFSFIMLSATFVGKRHLGTARMGNILLLPSGKFCSAAGDNGHGAMKVWRQERTSARSLHLTGWLCLWSQDGVGQQLRDGVGREIS